VRTAADLLEQLADTRSPVRREEDPWTAVR
jgi:hypothetical protein